MLKVIIIGGGIGGLTLARACLDRGMNVEVYEKRSLAQMLSGPGGIFIQRNALRVYRLLNQGQIYDRLTQQGGAIFKGGFFSQAGEPLYINSPDFIKEDNLGFCLLRPELQQILYDALPVGTVRSSQTFQQFEEKADGIRVFFQDGSSTEGDILVGADGLYSAVRSQVLSQKSSGQNLSQNPSQNSSETNRLEPPVYSGTCCWRGWFDSSNLPLDRHYSWAEFWGQGDRFGYFDVGSGRFSFYGFANTPAGGDDTATGGSLKALRSRFSAYGGPVPAILERLAQQPERTIYRDDIYDRPPLGQRWGHGRVTLIGDAAHPVQPTIGQGGCMAIEDAFELAKCLSLSSSAEATALRGFESSRSDRVDRVFKTSRQVSQLAQAEGAIACFLRNWIYKLTPTRLADQQFKWLFDYFPDWDSP